MCRYGWRYWEGSAAYARETALGVTQCQFNHRNDAGRLLLVFTELGIALRPRCVDAVALLTSHRRSDGIVGLGSDLDGDLRMGEEVVVPGGVGRCARFGREDE